MRIVSVIKKVLSIIPYAIFVKIYPVFKKSRIADIADSVYYKRFFWNQK